jgi:spore cortex formation protein SpoVR/YcgB (stage V sporulation)
VQDEDGNDHEVLVGAKINPYALGYAMYQDIERICDNPTDEDREWFKHFAGQGDSIGMIKHAMASSTDETFTQQYLSPAVMRKFAFFEIEDVNKNSYIEVLAVHDKHGFRKIRDQLAQDYRFSGMVPDIRVHDLQDTDQCLILRHKSWDGKRLEPESMTMILEHMHRQRGYPVVVESVNEQGEIVDTLSSPPDYEHKKFRRIDPQMDFFP